MTKANAKTASEKPSASHSKSSDVEEQCKKCDTAISRTKPPVSCSGFCSSTYHASCVGLPPEALKYLKTTGVFWYCGHCADVKNEYEKCVNNIVEDKIKAMIKNVDKLFSEAITEIKKAANDRLNMI